MSAAPQPRAKRRRKEPVQAELSLTEYFGRELKRHRLAQEMSQASLAYGAGISQTKITAIEAGRVNVHLRTADALAKSLGMKLKDLLPG